MKNRLCTYTWSDYSNSLTGLYGPYVELNMPKKEKSSEVPQGQLEISQRVLYHWFIGLNIRTVDYAEVYKDRERNAYSDARCE